MLVEHGSHDMRKGLIRGKQAVATGKEIPFQPTLAGVLTQDLHHPPLRSQVSIGIVILRKTIPLPDPIRHLKHRVEAVRGRLVWAEQPEIARLPIRLDDVTQEAAHDTGSFSDHRTWLRHLHGIVPEVGILRSLSSKPQLAWGLAPM